jgi:hypothetical protein
VKKVTILLILAFTLALCACDEGLAPVPFQGISGSITYDGSVPDSTEWVRVAAFQDLPQTEIELLDFAAISNELIPLEDSTRYVVDLDTGDYQWLPVVWKKADTPLTPDALRILGWYTSGGGPFDAPRPVPVESDQETANTNVLADYENALTIAEALEAIQ